MWEDLNSLVKDMNYAATDHITIKTWMLIGDEAPSKPFDEIESEIQAKADALMGKHQKKITFSWCREIPCDIPETEVV